MDFPHQWQAPLAKQPVVASVTLPGSKSEANRALVLAALCFGSDIVKGLPDSRDCNLMMDGLAALGVGFEYLDAQTVEVTPPDNFQSARIDCGLAGTIMRFLPPVAMLADGPCHFYGDSQASQRPMKPLLDCLRQLGAAIHDDEGQPTNCLPFWLDPPAAWAGICDSVSNYEQGQDPSLQPISPALVIDSSASSQFVSGLLMAGPRFPGGLDLRHSGPSLPSRPHIDMTIGMLKFHGVTVFEPEPEHWLVPQRSLLEDSVSVEPDLTNAAAFLGAGVLTGGTVSVAHWPETTNQPGSNICDIISDFGGWTKRNQLSEMEAGADGPLTATTVDLRNASELTPVVAALAAVAKGRSYLTGIGHIRGHETDRLQAITDALAAVGIKAQIEADGLIIDGGHPLHGGTIDSCGDHRIVHLAALLGLVADGVVVNNPSAVAKTLPDFTDRWETIVYGSGTK